MSTLTVTELPRHLDPADRLAGLRELAHRRSDGIDVSLLWEATADRVLLAVADARTGERFEVPVAGAEAWHAFQHPYVHAARGGP